MRPTSKAKRNVSIFSAAMATINVAPTLQADIVGLIATPPTVGKFQDYPVTLATTSALATVAQFTLARAQNYNALYAGGAGTRFLLGATSQTLTPQQIFAQGTTFTYNIEVPMSSSVIIAFSVGGNAGWFTLATNSDSFNGTITGGQYGNQGEPIHIGPSAIPEASSVTGLALLALGAAGVRRRKKDCQAQTAA